MCTASHFGAVVTPNSTRAQTSPVLRVQGTPTNFMYNYVCIRDYTPYPTKRLLRDLGVLPVSILKISVD